MQRTNSASRAVQAVKHPALVRPQSHEDLRKKTMEEKRRKNDEKMKQAQQLREAKDKEREEKIKKMFMVK